jgi:hypothetical protein
MTPALIYEIFRRCKPKKRLLCGYLGMMGLVMFELILNT